MYTTKAATGSCSAKKVFWGVFLPWNLRCCDWCNLIWEKELYCWKRSHTSKSMCSVKDMSLCLRYWGVLDFNWKNKLRASCKSTEAVVRWCSVKKMFLRIQWRLIFAIVIRCSRLRLWVGYFIYFKFTPV